MRVTRAQAAANREKILDVAGALFRQRGFDGIGVADIMRRAGSTHGGFYGRFDSKDDLAAEITTRILGRTGWLQRLTGNRQPVGPPGCPQVPVEASSRRCRSRLLVRGRGLRCSPVA